MWFLSGNFEQWCFLIDGVIVTSHIGWMAGCFVPPGDLLGRLLDGNRDLAPAED